MITKETLDKLRALLAKATPGPWRVATTINSTTADDELAAAAVNALPELLATIDAQREEIAAHVAQCNMVGAQRDALEAENAALRKRPLAGQLGVRGVDFPCEGCGKLEGSTLNDGWYRCNACGYPGK